MNTGRSDSMRRSPPVDSNPTTVDWLLDHKRSGTKFSLTEELKGFSKYVQLNSEECSARSDIVEEVKQSVLDVYPEAELKQFGSYPLGLSIYFSDLDLSIDNILSVAPEDGVGEQITNSEANKRELLRPVVGALHQKPQMHRVQFIRFAKVPLIKVEHACGVKMDISADSSKTTGAVVVQSLLDRCGPALVDLSAFLKVYLHQTKLDEPYAGGLGSYGLYLMLSLHIDRNPELINPITGPDLGELLLSFCRFYGNPENLNEKTVLEVEGADPFLFSKVSQVEIIRMKIKRVLKEFVKYEVRLAEAAEPPLNPSYLLRTIRATELFRERRAHRTAAAQYLRRKGDSVPSAATTVATTAARIGIDPLSKYLHHVALADKTSVALGVEAVKSLETVRGMGKKSYSAKDKSPNFAQKASHGTSAGVQDKRHYSTSSIARVPSTNSSSTIVPLIVHAPQPLLSISMTMTSARRNFHVFRSLIRNLC